MVDPKNQSNSDDPLRSESESQDKEKNAGQVVDELKKLLAGLGEEKPKSDEPAAPSFPDFPPDQLNSKLNSLEDSFFTDPVPPSVEEPSLPPAPTLDPPVDPVPASPPPPEPETEPQPEAIVPPEPAMQPEPEPTIPPEPESSPFETAGGAQIGMPEPTSDPVIPEPKKTESDAIPSLGDPFLMDSPAPSLSEGEIKTAPTGEPESLMPSPEELAVPMQPEPSPQPPAVPQPIKEPSPEDLAIPLPGTIEKKDDAAAPEDQSWQADDIKPEGICQVSCFFPTGCEEKAKDFVNRLQESGNRASVPVKIQSVFMQAWEKEAIDIPGWEKAAGLSGAEFTFVLAPKKDHTLFGDWVTKGRRGSWKGRIVSLEQTGMKALYADLIIQLGQIS